MSHYLRAISNAFSLRWAGSLKGFFSFRLCPVVYVHDRLKVNPIMVLISGYKTTDLDVVEQGMGNQQKERIPPVELQIVDHHEPSGLEVRILRNFTIV